MIRRALVLGARGQVGRFLLPRLAASDWHTLALSRRRVAAAPDVRTRWQAFDLCDGSDLAGEFDVVFSLGPLDAFAAWWRRSAVRAPRLIALSSTSAASKAASPDPAERALAARLVQAEQTVFEVSTGRGVATTVLRPTLIYGGGADRSLSRIVAVARRWHGFVLPRSACGLRQPVHADDLAAAAWTAAQCNATPASCYDLPGGETLSYRDMVQRVLDCLVPRPRLFEVPRPLFGFALWGAHRAGWLRDAGGGVLARLSQDLVFDPAPAQCDLGYESRAFLPEAAMFAAPGSD